MTLWKRVRGALGMGLLWALGGLAVGGGIELLDNVLPGGFARQVDMWPQTLAVLAFPRGVLFGALIALLGAGKRSGDFTYRQFGGWGALSGLVFGALGLVSGFDAGAFVITTALSVVAGVSTLATARLASRRYATLLHQRLDLVHLPRHE